MSLSLEQQDVLQQFQVEFDNQAITGIEDADSCVEILTMSRWDLQQAVERVLDNNFGSVESPLLPHPRSSLVSKLLSPLLFGFKFLWNILSFLCTLDSCSSIPSFF
jgi:hypothetical protein